MSDIKTVQITFSSLNTVTQSSRLRNIDIAKQVRSQEITIQERLIDFEVRN